MRKSRISEAKQMKLVEHFMAGTTARTAAQSLLIARKYFPVTSDSRVIGPGTV